MPRRSRFNPNQGSLPGFEPSPPQARIRRPRKVVASLTRGQLQDENLQFFLVSSSRISAAAYSESTDRLYLQWVKPGRPYVYEGVTPEEFRAFLRADSKGRYVNQVLNHKTYYSVDL